MAGDRKVYFETRRMYLKRGWGGGGGNDDALTQGGVDAASDLQEAIAPISVRAAVAVEHVEEGRTGPGEERARDVDHRVVVRTAAAAAQIEAAVPAHDRGPLPPLGGVVPARRRRRPLLLPVGYARRCDGEEGVLGKDEGCRAVDPGAGEGGAHRGMVGKKKERTLSECLISINRTSR